MRLFIIGFIGTFIFAFAADAHTEKKPTKADIKALKGFSGDWSRSKGREHLCADSLKITVDKKGEVLMVNTRPSASTTIEYKIGSVKTLKEKRDYKKIDKVREAYTLNSNYNTAVVGGRLVSNHLWSGEGQTWTSMGTKVYSLKDANTIVMEKAITSYGDNKAPEADEYKKDETKRVKLFEHADTFALRSSAYKCEYTKSKKVAKNK